MPELNNNNFYSGTSGLKLPFPKHSFPPGYQDHSRLAYYASLFNSLEVNSSFYKVPMAATVKKWADSVPQNFRFTFKLFRQITHNKGLAFNPADVQHFIQTISFAGDKKGCLLVQFPPGTSIAHMGQLALLLAVIREADAAQQWKVAVEFRNKSWYTEAVFNLLEQYNAAPVVHDMPASATPTKDPATDFVYLRFHGPEGRYRGSYADDILYEYAQYISDWQREGKTVYVYFNNTMGDALQNLETLRSFLVEQESL